MHVTMTARMLKIQLRPKSLDLYYTCSLQSNRSDGTETNSKLLLSSWTYLELVYSAKFWTKGRDVKAQN